jgi:predicted negative regulator of RcsB-dependent stress response
MAMYKMLNRRALTKCTLLALMLLCPGFSARERQQHKVPVVMVEGDFNDKLTQVVYDNAEACFNSLNETYFHIEPEKPLKIYLSQTAAEARTLIEDHGHLIEAGDGLYVPSVPAVYTYITTGDDTNITFEPLFASIAEHFVAQRFGDGPEWLRTSLISFLSKGAQIINGKLMPAGPCPRAGLTLRAEVEADTRLNIKKLYVSSDERYREWPSGPALAEALLCWLHQNGHLASYIREVPKKGYELEVLEEVSGESAGKMNVELKKFIEGDYCTAAYLAEAEDAQDPNQKEEALLTALGKKPDYPEAQLALARLYYSQGKYQLCHKALMPILARPEDTRFMPAARLAAEVLYNQNNYAQARDYYQKAWDNADNYVYKYQIAYKVANCSHYLDEPEIAAQWYNRFLELDFRPDKDRAAVAYAQKYVETFGFPGHKSAD